MGYKILGFAVWQGGKWYARRRMPDAARKVAIGSGLAAVAIVGVGLAVSQRNGQD